jgi:serine/threonine protein phosphatase PrpC
MNHHPSRVSPPSKPWTGSNLTYGSGTDKGLRRELNEDSYIAADPLFAVADGMGGHEAGEIASGLCVRALAEIPQLATGERSITAAVLQEYLQRADNSIREATGARAGTTLTGAVIVKQMGMPYWLVMNIGDSRTYRLSQGRLEQISVDHSEVQELVEAGEITAQEATFHPRRHVVTRALGTGEETEVDFWLLPVEDGDRLLVCSDGLTGELSDQDILQILSKTLQPQDAVDALIQAALRSGGRDNVTAIVVDASNVSSDDGAAITGSGQGSADGEEPTLSRPRVVDAATLPLPEQATASGADGD